LDYSRERILNEFQKLKLRIIQPRPKDRSFMKYFSKYQIRFIDDIYATGTVFFTLKDYVLIGTLVNDDFFVIKIESKDIAKTYKNYFEIMWKLGKS
jgi:hypothetical protein